MSIVKSSISAVQFGGSAPFMVRFLSESSQRLYTQMIKTVGVDNNDALISALLALDLALQSGRINKDERQLLESQMRIGTGYDASLTKKLSAVEQQALTYELSSRVHAALEEICLNPTLRHSTAVSDNKDDSLMTCIICLDSCPRDEGLQCGSGHFVCRTDLDKHVKESSTLNDLCTLRSRKGKVFCPSNPLAFLPENYPCKSDAFPDVALARNISNETFNLYLAAIKEVSLQETMEVTQETIHSEVRRLLREIKEGKISFSDDLFREQLRRLIPNPRQCPECKFGPMDPFGCSDLSAHHRENIANVLSGDSSDINNACPACGWFASTVEEWLPWDGKLPESFLGTNPAEIVQIPVCDDEELPAEEQPVNYRTRLCRYFMRGHCRNLGRCLFAHGQAQLRRVTRPPGAAETAPQAAETAEAVQHEGDDQETIARQVWHALDL